jgi:hypothetical protein
MVEEAPGGEMRIKVIRRPESLEYKRDPRGPDDWGNNDYHNSLDRFEFYTDEHGLEGDKLFWSCNVQTVANIPGGSFNETIAVGMFKLKAFVDSRNFWGRIHGLCDCYDLAHRYINMDSVEVTDQNRWLMHDWQKPKPSPAGEWTRVAWSAACFVVKPPDLYEFGFILDNLGVKPGDLINGELVEQA